MAELGEGYGEVEGLDRACVPGFGAAEALLTTKVGVADAGICGKGAGRPLQVGSPHVGDRRQVQVALAEQAVAEADGHPGTDLRRRDADICALRNAFGVEEEVDQPGRGREGGARHLLREGLAIAILGRGGVYRSNQIAETDRRVAAPGALPGAQRFQQALGWDRAGTLGSGPCRLPESTDARPPLVP